jgi:predicted  nucleic acid-binding Zn-ribbon protein
MRRTTVRLRAILLFCLTTALFTACGDENEPATSKPAVSSGDVKKEIRDASEGSLAYIRHQRDEYQKQIEAQLKEYDQKLDELEVKAGAVKQEARALLNQQIQALREKQRAAHDELDQLSTATGKAWEDLKSGTDAAMEDLAKAYHEALSHFE